MYFLQFWRLGESKIKASDRVVSDEDPLPSVLMTVFSPCSHAVEGERELSGASILRALIPFMTALPSRPDPLPKAPPLRFQHMNFGGT